MIIAITGLAAGCVTTEVDKAFNGQFELYKETSVIVDYCQSCHVHRKFNPSDHMAQAQSLYKTAPFTTAADCRTCHSIQRNIWNQIVRATHYPGGTIIEAQ